MARDYDVQLLESVSVRRRRLRDAFLFGTQASRRSYPENVGRFVASVTISAVLAAGCVGYSFIRHHLAAQEATSRPAPVTTTAPVR
ncbi:hypothetical protein AWW66_00185 [Micromonospora rosaria]|uniref:Uncharacterized protein n=1 Tax=Micromonospora rosaria TaxID=47874 RepID=A0A136Q023_9ACTN|nr:hypothetical protein [Micromonospora rosaria]KXK63997.1 hypothetical protein AWW66_00185 [Micromonospora rosaria]